MNEQIKINVSSWGSRARCFRVEVGCGMGSVRWFAHPARLPSCTQGAREVSRNTWTGIWAEGSRDEVVIAVSPWCRNLRRV